MGASLADSDEDPVPVVESGEIEVWRKLYYQVTEMRRPDGDGTYELSDAMLGQIETAYRKVFIALERVGAKRIVGYETNIRPKTMRAMLHRDWRYPLKLHFVTCDSRIHPIDAKWKERMEGPVATQPDRWLPADPDAPALDSVFAAEYRWDREGWDTWKDLPDGVVREAERDPSDPAAVRLKVDLRGTVLVPSPERPIRIRIRYRKAGPVGGFRARHLGASVGLCVGSFERLLGAADTKAALPKVAVHEAGHALDLVNDEIASKIAESAHCEHETCVMYEYAGAHTAVDFHRGEPELGCAEWLRGLDLDRSGSRAAEWSI